MGKEDTSTGEVAAPITLTAIDIQQKEFRVSRFGGYKMRDVDEFLDQLTEAFSALAAENQRLRSGGAAPVVGSPDLDDVSRQADEIIARARAEASRITSEARASAAAAPVGTAASTDATERGAVNAFLSQEREFLQSLAGLVQQHAEAVKGMAKASRPAPRATAPASPAGGTAQGAPAETVEEGASEAGEPAAEAAEGAREAKEPDEQEAPTRLPESEETVRIEEPAAARTARGDAEPEGDRSLRELFWGEE